MCYEGESDGSRSKPLFSSSDSSETIPGGRDDSKTSQRRSVSAENTCSTQQTEADGFMAGLLARRRSADRAAAEARPDVTELVSTGQSPSCELSSLQVSLPGKTSAARFLWDFTKY